MEAWLILANQGIKEDKDLIKVVVNKKRFSFFIG